MRQGLGIRQVIDGHDLNILIAVGCPEKISPDPAEAINPYLYAHRGTPFKWYKYFPDDDIKKDRLSQGKLVDWEIRKLEN